MTRGRRNLRPATEEPSKQADRLLRRALGPILDSAFRPPKPQRGRGRRRANTSSRASVSQPPATPAEGTYTLNTPSSYTAALSTPLSASFTESLLAGTPWSLATGGQLPAPGPSNPYPDPTLQYPEYGSGHEQGSMYAASMNMDPNSPDGYRHQPQAPTPNVVDPGTTNTLPYTDPLPATAYNLNYLSGQTPDITNTFNLPTWQQQPQLLLDPTPAQPLSYIIRRPGHDWQYTMAHLDDQMRRSFITPSAARMIGLPPSSWTPFPSDSHARAWAQDGNATPRYYVTIDIAVDGIFSAQPTRVDIAIFPENRPCPIGTGLIVGRELWRNLYPS